MGRGKRSQSTAIALVQRQLLVSWVAKSHFSQKWAKLKENLHLLFAFGVWSFGLCCNSAPSSLWPPAPPLPSSPPPGWKDYKITLVTRLMSTLPNRERFQPSLMSIMANLTSVMWVMLILSSTTAPLCPLPSQPWNAIMNSSQKQIFKLKNHI